MGFCTACGGIVRNNVGPRMPVVVLLADTAQVCLECRKTNTSAPSLTEQSESTFSREGPYWEQGSSPAKPAAVAKPAAAAIAKPAAAPAVSAAAPVAQPIPQPANVVKTADGRYKNNYRHSKGSGPKLCTACGQLLASAKDASCSGCGAAVSSIF